MVLFWGTDQVQYDHPDNRLPGSPNLFPNHRNAKAKHIQLPVINVACLTPEPQWIALQVTPGANYTVTEPIVAEDIPTNVQITGTLDANITNPPEHWEVWRSN